jgi:hypothetical protein
MKVCQEHIQLDKGKEADLQEAVAIDGSRSTLALSANKGLNAIQDHTQTNCPAGQQDLPERTQRPNLHAVH